MKHLSPTEYESFRVKPCTPLIGGEIIGGDFTHITDRLIEDLRKALFKYGVIFGNEKHVTIPNAIKIMRGFGDSLEKHPFAPHPDYSEVTRIETSPERRNAAFVNNWHHDVTYRERPVLGSILLADVVQFGADTVWSSTTAAYRKMPEPIQNLFKSLRVNHMALQPVRTDDYSGLQATHPAVVKHYVTGEPCIFVADQFHRKIPGIDQKLAEVLFRIYDHYCLLPELQVRHQWKKGDFALWDNFLTCHYGVTGNLTNEIRRMYRVAAESDTVRPEPFLE